MELEEIEEKQSKPHLIFYEIHENYFKRFKSQ